MAAVRHLVFVRRLLGPPTMGTWAIVWCYFCDHTFSRFSRTLTFILITFFIFGRFYYRKPYSTTFQSNGQVNLMLLLIQEVLWLQFLTPTKEVDSWISSFFIHTHAERDTAGQRPHTVIIHRFIYSHGYHTTFTSIRSLRSGRNIKVDKNKHKLQVYHWSLVTTTHSVKAFLFFRQKTNANASCTICDLKTSRFSM